MKTKITTRQIAGVGVMTALVAVLWAISTFVPMKPLTLNLALVPIVVGACIYGPWWGLFLGVVDGLLIVVDPGTAPFIAENVFLTILLCSVKTGVGGLVSGLLFKLIYKKNDLIASIVASLVLPIINTGIFILGARLFFFGVFGNDFKTLVTAAITINFVVEFIIAIVMSPAIYKIIKIAAKNMDIGSVNN